MVNTIQEALNYFYFVAFLFGFGILRHPLNYPRVRLSILYILSIWSIYAYILYYVLTIISSSDRKYFMLYVYLTINLLVTTTTIIITICKHKNFNVLINKLSQVDDTLAELGTPKEYRRMQNLIICIIIMWFIMICIIIITNFLCYNESRNHIQSLFIPIVLNYTYVINILIDIIVMFLLSYIGTRYDKINYYIKQLSETEECGLRCTWRKSLVTRYYICSKVNRKRILWTTMHLHSQLCRVALNINSFFKMQMTLQTMSYLVTLTTMFYFQYHMMLCLMYNGGAVQWKCLLASNVWLAINLIRLISLNYICESVSAKAQKTEGIIHKLTNIICFAEAREEICQFVLQISLQPLKFSGMGLFYFGHKFLCKCFIWILSVIIIIIQVDTFPVYRKASNRDNIICHEFSE